MFKNINYKLLIVILTITMFYSTLGLLSDPSYVDFQTYIEQTPKPEIAGRIFMWLLSSFLIERLVTFIRNRKSNK